MRNRIDAQSYHETIRELVPFVWVQFSLETATYGLLVEAYGHKDPGYFMVSHHYRVLHICD